MGQYIGHTAPRTRSILLETLEGVLFIDEAYQLTPGNPMDFTKDFGSEAITEIVNFLDKYVGMSTVILAGYENLMREKFFPSNEGLWRRFPIRVHLGNYSVCELVDILVHFIENKSDITVDADLGNWLFSVVSYLSEEFTDKAFPNQAGDMLNLGSSIVASVNSSYAITWEPNDIQHNIPILTCGLNEYLQLKDLEIV